MTAESPGPVADLAATVGRISVVDPAEVSPRIARAGAELAALKLRLAAVTHRAEAAEALAGPIGASELTLEEQVADLDRRLEQEHVEHRRRLEDEIARARAEADEKVARARIEAVETVRAATRELDQALADAGLPARDPSERPVDAAPPVAAPGSDGLVEPVPLAAVDPPAPVLPPAALAPVDDDRPTWIQRAAQAGPVVPLTAIAVLLALILLRVW